MKKLTEEQRGILKGFLAGIITVAILFTMIVNKMPKLSVYNSEHPTRQIVTCDFRLTDTNGLSLDKNANGQWELSSDQDVLVWLDLPDDIEELDADISSSYPYEVKAGETGVIKIEAYCSSNYTEYIGSLEFVATDDLTLGAVGHGANYHNSSIVINNDTNRNFSWMEEGKHAYVHYPLYTSCAGEYNVYPIRGGQSSTGYEVSFDISATGAPEMLYVSSYPDGDPEKEAQAQLDAKLEEARRSEDRQQAINDQIEELEGMLKELETQQ